jgi:ABC-type multidrug transport system ATPase subunit
MAVINRGELIAQGSVSELLDREPTDYTLQASPYDLALEVVRKLPWVKVLSSERGQMEVRVEGGRASDLNRFLMTNDIEVASFYPHRTLEDFFLKITKGKTDL